MNKTTSGNIQAFDQGDRTITLDGGRNFYLTPSVDLTVWKTNDVVTVTYEESKDGTRVASEIVKGIMAPSPNVLVRESKAPKPAVNTTASLKAKT